MHTRRVRGYLGLRIAPTILRLYATPAPPCRQTPTGVRNGVSTQNRRYRAQITSATNRQIHDYEI